MVQKAITLGGKQGETKISTIFVAAFPDRMRVVMPVQVGFDEPPETDAFALLKKITK